MTGRPRGPRAESSPARGSELEPGPADAARIATLLGRPPRGPVTVARRRNDGTPSVIASSPLLDDGTPMPTRYWLVDRELREAVARLESEGGVRAAEAEVDPHALVSAHRRYAAERDALVPRGHVGPRPSGGVGGTKKGVKCLHAHLAWWLVGGDDPVGAWVADRIGLGPRERGPRPEAPAPATST